MTEAPVAPHVVLKDVPPIDVVGVRARLPLSEVARLFQQAGAKLHTAPAGPPIGIYYDRVINPEAVDVEVDFPVAEGAEETLLPAHVASLVYHGPYDGISQAYAALLRWTAEHGLHADGPAREVYLSMPDAGDPVTEVQIPVR